MERCPRDGFSIAGTEAARQRGVCAKRDDRGHGSSGVTYLTDVFWGLLAGFGGVALSFLNIGPLLLGAVLSGLSTGLWARWDRGGG